MSGRIVAVSGPTVEAAGLPGGRMHDLVSVGPAGLLGEIIRLSGDTATIQVYEDTTGLRPGEAVTASGRPLAVELGPGLLSGVFDGVQRRLHAMEGPRLSPGATAPALSRTALWDFTPRVQPGQEVVSGQVLGVVQETIALEHRILVPPTVAGRIREIRSGPHTVVDPVAWLEDGTALFLKHEWPVRRPRPVRQRLSPEQAFLTGQRVFDCLFPLARGGTAIVPGGFGTGKTVVEQTVARHCNAKVIIYVGCGERGNEMTDVLDEFPRLTDPHNGRPLMERTILVVNTSNMPVAAREASIYTGMTLAEYYRDMGYDVALLADSVSRWAEALREISSRLEEIPGEEGYPPYLSTRLSQFYQRGGRVACLGTEAEGSVTVIAAISPPGGDLSEPVTQGSLRLAGALWALDPGLAHRRHYPAVDWTVSFSQDTADLDGWFVRQVSPDWPRLRQAIGTLLLQEQALQEAVQLVGIDAVADDERIVLETARLMREVFLRQHAYSAVDAYCPLPRQGLMARAILAYGDKGQALLRRGVALETVLAHPARTRLLQMAEEAGDLEPLVSSIEHDLEGTS